MIDLQACKFVSVTNPAAIVDNASYTTAVIDTIGYDHCTIIVQVGATDIAMTALKITESEASDMTGAVDVSGAVYGTSTLPALDGGATSALPSDTDDNKMFAFHVNLQGRMRYLDLVATAGNGTAGTYLTAIAILSRGAVSPATAVNRGLAANLIV